MAIVFRLLAIAPRSLAIASRVLAIVPRVLAIAPRVPACVASLQALRRRPVEYARRIEAAWPYQEEEKTKTLWALAAERLRRMRSGTRRRRARIARRSSEQRALTAMWLRRLRQLPMERVTYIQRAVPAMRRRCAQIAQMNSEQRALTAMWLRRLRLWRLRRMPIERVTYIQRALPAMRLRRAQIARMNSERIQRMSSEQRALTAEWLCSACVPTAERAQTAWLLEATQSTVVKLRARAVEESLERAEKRVWQATAVKLLAPAAEESLEYVEKWVWLASEPLGIETC